VAVADHRGAADSLPRVAARYPVLYLHDGSADWFKRGRLLNILDTYELPEIADRSPEPINRTREYKLSQAHMSFVAHELVPWADATLRRVRVVRRAPYTECRWADWSRWHWD